jgi:leucyl aminopeptidase
MKTAVQLAEAVNYTRQLAQQPGNVINPKTLATEARKLAGSSKKMTCKVVEGPRLKQLNMNGLIGVGQGAEHPGRLIQLDYKGNPNSKNRLVLVGKAITFDTGGYSIKPSAGLANLKYDKTGGCTVMGVVKAAALLGLKCNVTALVAAAENMVSDKAYRAGDILKMANGKSVEVTNTDAEGRLVLADALWYAQKYCKPTALVDMATLTGGVMVALGSVAAGLMANNDSLAADLEESGRATRERLWRLPLWDDYRDLMKGVDSDLVNSSPKRDAHCIQGGIFLKEFVENKTPWAHLDIAAVATNDAGGGKIASGFGVRLMIEYLRRNYAA